MVDHQWNFVLVALSVSFESMAVSPHNCFVVAVSLPSAASLHAFALQSQDLS